MSASHNFSARQIIDANIRGIERGLIMAYELLQDDLQNLLTQAGTGKEYYGGKKGKGDLRKRSVAGSPPAVDTGTLLRSVQTSKPKKFAGRGFLMVVMAGLVAGINEDARIPRWLEEGTAKMGKRPFISPALKEIKPAVKGLISDNMIRAVQKMQMGAMRKA